MGLNIEGPRQQRGRVGVKGRGHRSYSIDEIRINEAIDQGIDQ